MNTAYNAGAHAQAAVGIDRNTSIRSVMTLPAYSQDPKATEQVIGREGERAGMDVVIEFPETVDEEENRREEQMESLYQIRLARRTENAEREARRQRRRELRAAGDWAGLDQMRRESRARADEAASLANMLTTSAATLIAEHQSRERERRVSSVSYADVGQVRHDGSRLRANSAESDNLPLLDSAASMADARSSRVSLGSSTFVPPPSLLHRREQSTGSMLSVVTTWSDFSHPGQRTPARSSQEMLAGSRPRSDSRRASDVSGARVSPPLQDQGEMMANDADGDIGGSRIPLSVEPPRYDDEDDHSAWEEEAPAYTSPEATERPTTWAVDTRPSTTTATTSTPTRNSTIGLIRLPSIRPLPAIELETATPTSPIRMSAVAEHETR